MPQEVFLTIEPLYAHFRLTSPSEVDEDDELENPDYLMREFDGDRYTAALATTILDNRLLFSRRYYDALIFEFTELNDMISGADEEGQEEFLDDPIDVDRMIEKYDLKLERLDQEVVERETERWIEVARTEGLATVIDHLEEYQTGQVTIEPQASQRLRLRTHNNHSGDVLHPLQKRLNKNVGTVLACAVDWYNMKSEGLDVAEEFPIVTTSSSSCYEERHEIYELIDSHDSTHSSNSPKLVCLTDIET